MEDIGKLLTYIMEGMQHTFNVYGHEVSLWMIFMFTIVAGIVAGFIGGLLNGD